MTERQIERWWRYRRAQDKPSTLVKFCENSWRFMYYTYSFTFGLYVLWDKPWFWDVKNCWYGYPHQVIIIFFELFDFFFYFLNAMAKYVNSIFSLFFFQSVDTEIWSYYMFSMSFYWSLVVSQFFDVKRKDFWQMFVHHIVTLLLMALSWVCNLHRVGSLVLVIHDCADIFLEAAKITKYAGYQKLCDGVFAAFTVIWIATRLGFYPRIIYSTSIEAPSILPMFPAYYIFNSLLILLLFLHILWTYLILKIAYDSLKSGKVCYISNCHNEMKQNILIYLLEQMEGDCRSSSSELSDSSENAKAAVTNGTPQKKNPPKSRSISKSPKRPTQTAY